MADTALDKAAAWSQVVNTPISVLALAVVAVPLLRSERLSGTPVQEAGMTSYWPLALLAFCILASTILHVVAIVLKRKQGVSTSPPSRGWRLRTKRIIVLCGVGMFFILMTWVIVKTFRYEPEPVQQPAVLSIPQFQGAKDLIEIRNRTFVNERVMLDGHRYTGCRFFNPTFVYNGTKGFGFEHNTVGGIAGFSSDSEVVTAAWVMAKVFSPLGMTLVDENFEPLKGVEMIQVEPEPTASPAPTQSPKGRETKPVSQF